jgi:corrinoid protein of di/trimethylamine methyltransferase
MTDLKNLYFAILRGNLDSAIKTTSEALEEGIDPQSLISDYMIPAMDKVGDMFEKCEAFVPELLLAARAMKGSLGLIQPHLSGNKSDSKGKVIIGTVQGDLHDIGKNIVASMLEGSGFEVINLGNDVSPQKFVEAVKTYQPDILAMSALLTTTMTAMETTITAIQESGLRHKVKIMIGGAPVTRSFTEKIGAEGFSDNANGAVKLARALVEQGK